MKIKYFLRGFGTGILFTTIILTIAYTVKSNDQDAEKTTVYNEELTIADETEETTIQKTTEQTTQEITTQEITTQEQTSQVSAVQNITITSGMSSTSVANKLQSLGVIQNANEFDAYLISNGYSKKIMTGTYNIKSGASYNEIAESITR